MGNIYLPAAGLSHGSSLKPKRVPSGTPIAFLSFHAWHPARAGRHGRSNAILLTLFQDRSTSDFIGLPLLRGLPVDRT